MRFRRTLTLATLVFAAACAPQDSPTEPQFGVVPEKGKPQDIACRPADLKAVQNGKIKPNDCLFGVDQREDIYRVDQLALGLPDFSGTSMLTFTPDAGFDGIYGVSNWDETRFGDPVYGYQTFSANDQSRTFSIIGSDAEYKMFFSGIDGTQTGKYQLTTTVAPSANSCETGSRTFLQGSVAFSSAITPETSCAGEITVGPNSGPINYQFWYAKLTQGQEVTVSIDGVDPTQGTVTLAVIVFSSDPNNPVPFSILNFSEGPGDTDRSITFEAPFETYYYIEVSSRPEESSAYNFSFTSN